jgi:hypothetical protein
LSCYIKCISYRKPAETPLNASIGGLTNPDPIIPIPGSL